MLIEEALRLRQNWAMKGNPSCSHPTLDREYFQGKDTYNHVCMVCGQSFTRDQWEQENKRRENETKSIVDSWFISRTGRFIKGIRSQLKWCTKPYTSLSRIKTNNRKRHSE